MSAIETNFFTATRKGNIMASNSKLDSHGKLMRKEYLQFLAWDSGAIVTSTDGRVTLAFKPEFVGSRMLRLAISYCSPDEIKVRRKVGEYMALRRLYETDQYIAVSDGFDPVYLADVFADI